MGMHNLDNFIAGKDYWDRHRNHDEQQTDNNQQINQQDTWLSKLLEPFIYLFIILFFGSIVLFFIMLMVNTILWLS